MQEQRRADLVWIGEEVKDFEQLKVDAERNRRTIPRHIKEMMKRNRS